MSPGTEGLSAGAQEVIYVYTEARGVLGCRKTNAPGRANCLHGPLARRAGQVLQLREKTVRLEA